MTSIHIYEYREDDPIKTLFVPIYEFKHIILFDLSVSWSKICVEFFQNDIPSTLLCCNEFNILRMHCITLQCINNSCKIDHAPNNATFAVLQIAGIFLLF